MFEKLPNFGSGVGLPQIFSMIGRITKDKKSLDTNFNTYQLYGKMWDISFEEWYKDKGELRTNLMLENQKMKLNSLMLHELKAMQRFAPEKETYCDIDPKDDWQEVYLFGCGLMTKRDNEFVFVHETFCEYFVVEFIMRNLRDLRYVAEAFEFMQTAILNDKHNIIRRFLNEALEDEINESKYNLRFDTKNVFDNDKELRLDLMVPIIKEEFKKQQVVCNFFLKELQTFDTLGEFLIEILTRKCTKKTKKVVKIVKYFSRGFLEQMKCEQEKLIVQNPSGTNWAFFLPSYTLRSYNSSRYSKILDKSQRLIVEFINSAIDLPTLLKVMDEINKVKGETFIKDVLKYRNQRDENILCTLIQSPIATDKQFEKFLQFMRNFLSPSEIDEEMNHYNFESDSVLNHFGQHPDKSFTKFEVFWKGFEQYYKDKPILSGIKTRQEKKDWKNILILMLRNTFDVSFSIYERFWNFSLAHFEDDNEGLRKFLLEENANGKNLIMEIIAKDNIKKGESMYFALALKKLENALTKVECREIIKSKFGESDNLFAYIICNAYQDNIHEVLWNFILYAVESNEDLLDILRRADNFGNNLITLIYLFDYCDFYGERIEKLKNEERLKKKDIKKLLFSLNKFGQNFLQFFPGDFISHEELWKILRDQFTPTEIIKLVRHRDIFGCNYLNICISHKDKSSYKLAISEIIKELEANGLADAESIKRFKKFVQNEIPQISDTDRTEVLSFNWIKDDFQPEKLPSTTNEELKMLLLHVNKNGKNRKNMITQMLISGYINIITPVLEEIINELNIETLKNIFNTVNDDRENLLQILVHNGVSSQVYEFLWKLMWTKIDFETIWNILTHKDRNGTDLLHSVAAFGTQKIVELTWTKIKEVFINLNSGQRDQIRKWIENRSSGNENILLLAASGTNCTLFTHFTQKRNNFLSPCEFNNLVMQVNTIRRDPTILFRHTECVDKSCHEALWETLLYIFDNKTQLKDFVMHHNRYKRNFLHNLIEKNTSVDIMQFTFEVLKQILGNEFKKLLLSKDVSDRILLHHALQYSKSTEIIKYLWQNYQLRDNFPDQIFGTDVSEMNIFHYTALYSTSEVLKFVCDKMTILDDRLKVKKALLSQDDLGANLLLHAAQYNNSYEFHKILWNLIETFLDENEILELINQNDQYGEDVLFKTVRCNTEEVIELTWNNVKYFLKTETKQKQYIARKNRMDEDLMELAAQNNITIENIQKILKIGEFC